MVQTELNADRPGRSCVYMLAGNIRNVDYRVALCGDVQDRVEIHFLIEGHYQLRLDQAEFDSDFHRCFIGRPALKQPSHKIQ